MGADDLPAVTMGMGETEAATLAQRGFGQEVMDQLWLRTIMIMQRRQIRLAERDAYDRRCDRLLEAVRAGARSA